MAYRENRRRGVFRFIELISGSTPTPTQFLGDVGAKPQGSVRVNATSTKHPEKSVPKSRNPGHDNNYVLSAQSDAG